MSDRTFKVIDVLRLDEPVEHASRLFVRFPVNPPVLPTQDGQRVRLRSESAYIDVRMTSDGHIEISGSHRIAIAASTSNQVEMYLSDEDEHFEDES